MRLCFEALRSKIKRFYFKQTVFLRKNKISDTDWTIISNNCWGGFISQSYGLKYKSPTVGGFFMAEDYLEFISDLQGWAKEPMLFIKSDKSKYIEYWNGWKKFGIYPIGIIKRGQVSIEYHFLHYHSEEEAEKHWNERVKRINWNKILYKFNDQNDCTEEHLIKFASMSLEHKISFTCKDYGLPDTIYIKCPKQVNEIPSSYEPIGKSKLLDVNGLINKL